MLPNFAQKYQPIDEWILWWIYNLFLPLSQLFPCFHIFSFSKNIIPISILFVQQSDNIGDKLWCYSTILIVTTKHIMVVHHTSFSTKKVKKNFLDKKRHKIMENRNMLIRTLYHLTTNALLIFNKKDINLIVENILLFYEASIFSLIKL